MGGQISTGTAATKRHLHNYEITAVETIVIECCASIKERCVNSQLRGKTSAFDSRGRMVLTHSQAYAALTAAFHLFNQKGVQVPDPQTVLGKDMACLYRIENRRRRRNANVRLFGRTKLIKPPPPRVIAKLPSKKWFEEAFKSYDRKQSGYVNSEDCIDMVIQFIKLEKPLPATAAPPASPGTADDREAPSIFCGTPAEEREAGEDSDNFDASTVAGSSSFSSWSPWDGSPRKERGVKASVSANTVTSSERLSFTTDASAWSPKETMGRAKPWGKGPHESESSASTSAGTQSVRSEIANFAALNTLSATPTESASPRAL
jgi:hypothetical protein